MRDRRVARRRGTVIRAVFLDLDETLCESGPAWSAGVTAAFDLLRSRRPDLDPGRALETWNGVNERLLKRLNRGELTMRQVRERRFRRTLERLDAADEELAEELNDTLGRERLAKLHLYDDAVPAIEALRPNYHVGVITNGAGDDHDDSQWSTLRQLGLLDRLDSIWISDEVGFRKPDPRIFEGALDEVGMDPSEAVHVGDSPSKDVAGANAAGLTSVLIWRGAGEPELTRDEERPRRVVRTLVQVAEALSIRR